MDESFNHWRNPQNEEVSGDESDFVDDSGLVNSKSGGNILVPDSDEEVLANETSQDISESEVVPSSDEEEHTFISARSSNTSIPSANKQMSYLSRKEEVSLLRSPVTPLIRKNKKRCILDSDKSNSESPMSPSGDLLSSTKTGNISTARNSYALVVEEANVIDESGESLDLSTLNLDSIEAEPVVKNNNLIVDSESEEDTANKEVILIHSDSEDDLGISRRKDSQCLNDPKTSLNEHIPSIDLTTNFPVEEKEQNYLQSNEFSSRLDSMKLERQKLQMNVSDIMKDIECTKITLRSADIETLPDRGVRLQMKLKQQEAKLRDLRYQQGTLSNEIIKLEISSKVANQPPLVAVNKYQPTNKIYKLPTSGTDVNTMGKKAMETHRVQQALTVDALRGLHSSLKNCPEENTLALDPKGLLVELMPHQKHGLAWLMWREKEKPSGGILADDMGLGKTLTLIALILKSAQEEDEDEENSSDSEEENDEQWLSSKRSSLKRGNTLVVCPATLLGQWEGEIKNKLKRNQLSYVVHHGPNREKKARKLAEPDVVITTYNIVGRDGTTNTLSPLFQIKWRRIILDEAHQIRNHQTQTAKGVFLLKGRSRWALTGTPVHNKEIDLYALLKFLRCKPFDDLQVWKRWVDNKDAAGMQRISIITKSLMLRRTKQGLQEKGELKSLTDKQFHNVFITMDKEEKSTYERLLNFSKTLFAQFLHQKAEKENALNGLPVATKPAQYLKNAQNPFEEHPELARLHKQMTEISDIKTHTILVLILRLRQFCCQPALIKTMLENEDVKSVGIEDNDGLDMAMMDKLTRMSLKLDTQHLEDEKEEENEEEGLTLKNPLFSENRLSSKLQNVLSKVEEILPSNDKIIVVSQWVSVLDVMYHLLKDKNVRCAMLTGKVPVPDRAILVDKFNNPERGPRVLLLSLTAGGVGLNLVGANHLLMIDPHWNPQLERQAFDRIYRVGQVKDVHIYKFITSETIEENISKLQEKKLSIADDVLTGSNQKSKLSLDDLKMLFSFQK